MDEKWKWTAESATRNSKWLRTLRIISSSVKETGFWTGRGGGGGREGDFVKTPLFCDLLLRPTERPSVKRSGRRSRGGGFAECGKVERGTVKWEVVARRRRRRRNGLMVGPQSRTVGSPDGRTSRNPPPLPGTLPEQISLRTRGAVVPQKIPRAGRQATLSAAKACFPNRCRSNPPKRTIPWSSGWMGSHLARLLWP